MRDIKEDCRFNH